MTEWKELPVILSNMRCWSTLIKEHSFVIVLEENMGDQFKDWSGYSISWRRISDGKTFRVPPPYYNSFEGAKEHCERLMKEMGIL